jgi:hypothetical protein
MKQSLELQQKLSPCVRGAGESPFVALCTVKLRNQSIWLEVNVADLRHTMASFWLLPKLTNNYT